MSKEPLLVTSATGVHVENKQLTDVKTRYLGRLRDFGLGEGKIASDVEDYEIPELLRQLVMCIVQHAQDGYSACIDGRVATALLSGEPAPVRVRKAGGSVAPFAATCIAKGPLFASFPKATAQEIYQGVVDFQARHGKKESGHVDQFGPSCGAANGAEVHADAIVRKAEAMTPVVTALLPEFDHGILIKEMRQCVEGAAAFRDLLRRSKWNGPAIVTQAGAREPAGVEVLRAEHDMLRGHAERGLLIIDIPGYSFDEKQFITQGLGEWFVWNLDETKNDAQLEAIDEASYRRLCVAGVLNHLGVSNNLPAGNMPVIFFTSKK